MLENYENRKNLSYFLMALGSIVMIGVIMVYSSSYMYAKEKYGGSTFFVSRQVVFLIISIIACYIIAKTKYRFWYKFSYYLNIGAAFILSLTFIPGLSNSAKGASRWIKLGPLSLQPGELVKYTVLLSSIYFFENFKVMNQKSRIKHGISLFFPLILLILQPDFGTFSICFAVIGFTCFLSSFPRKWFYQLVGGGAIFSIIVLISQTYRVKRLLAFLDPWKNAQGSGFQVIQSWIGFANGGFFGRGPGNSIEKLFYLPEAHNDFIFSVIGEEFGFIGVFTVICLFLVMLYFGLRLAITVQSRVSYLMITSFVFVLGLQTLLNMGVVLGLLPTKGLNLPFISYGGSSLLANFIAIGVIISASKNVLSLNDENLVTSKTSGQNIDFADRMRLNSVRKEVRNN